MEKPELWATGDVARELGVNRSHVHRLVSSGQLSLFQETVGGQKLFERGEVMRVKRRRGAQSWSFKWDTWEARSARSVSRTARALLERELAGIRPGMLKAKVERETIVSRPASSSKKTRRIA